MFVEKKRKKLNEIPLFFSNKGTKKKIVQIFKAKKKIFKDLSEKRRNNKNVKEKKKVFVLLNVGVVFSIGAEVILGLSRRSGSRGRCGCCCSGIATSNNIVLPVDVVVLRLR